MILKNTAGLMKKKLSEQAFGSYAVYVALGSDEKILTSPDVNGDTYFDIASCGKILHTTPLVMQAIAEGKFSLGSTLPEFFKNVPEDKKGITVRQLLTHSSGIVRSPLTRELCAEGADAIAAHILERPLAYAPDTNSIYSCNGMNLLGFIVEKTYGKRMDQLFEERIKNPLGMTRSRFEIAVNEPNAVTCYSRRDAGDSRFDDDNVRAMGRVCGAGGSFFTLNDLIKYVDAVMNKDERLFPARLWDDIERDYTPTFSAGRGLGFLMVDKRYRQTGNLFPAGSFGHCGHTGQSIFVNRSQNLRVIILSNATRFLRMKSNFTTYDYGIIMALREEIHNMILEDLIFEGRL